MSECYFCPGLPRPCVHDRGAPLPKPKPLGNWMRTHECLQRDPETRWDGAPLEPNMLASSTAQRARVQRWHEAH